MLDKKIGFICLLFKNHFILYFSSSFNTKYEYIECGNGLKRGNKIKKQQFHYLCYYLFVQILFQQNALYSAMLLMLTQLMITWSKLI